MNGLKSMKTKKNHGLNLKPEERFLFEKLPDVVRLEAAMKGIRLKYSQFWDAILNRVQGEHPELNCPCNHSTDSWEQVGIGRERYWPSPYKTWPSGFYIWDISFESLCSSDAEAPSAGIYLKPPKSMRIDFESLREPFRRKAERRLGVKLLGDSSSMIFMRFGLPESRQELLALLTKEKAGQFADCMVAHFGRLAKLSPLIDEVFKIKGKSSN